jgi:hypothetical protein
MAARVELGALPDLPAGVDRLDVLLALATAALSATAGEIELLESRPRRDDLQFGSRPRPAAEHLAAWLYAPAHRIAYAVHAPDWTPPPGGTARDGWVALLADHLHATQRWTDVNVVAMPVHVPFDEPGLRVVPLLALWTDVSPDGQAWLGGTMASSLRRGSPHVVPVQCFSGTRFAAAQLLGGVTTVDVVPRAALAGPTAGW